MDEPVDRPMRTQVEDSLLLFGAKLPALLEERGLRAFGITE